MAFLFYLFFVAFSTKGSAYTYIYTKHVLFFHIRLVRCYDREKPRYSKRNSQKSRSLYIYIGPYIYTGKNYEVTVFLRFACCLLCSPNKEERKLHKIMPRNPIPSPPILFHHTSHPTPSILFHSTPFHPIPSHPVPTHPLPSHSIPFRPIYNPIPSNPIPSHLDRRRSLRRASGDGLDDEDVRLPADTEGELLCRWDV